MLLELHTSRLSNHTYMIEYIQLLKFVRPITGPVPLPHHHVNILFIQQNMYMCYILLRVWSICIARLILGLRNACMFNKSAVY